MRLHRPASARGAATLVEALIGLTLALVVLAVVVGLAWWAASSFRRIEGRTDVRERGHLALDTIRTVLMDAWRFQPRPDGRSALVGAPRLAGALVFDPAAGQLRLEPAGQPPRVLIGSGVTALTLDLRGPGFVRVLLELAAPHSDPRKLEGSLFLQEDISIPMLASRTATRGWNPIFEN